MKSPIYYQYLYGEHQGDVVLLDHIDDIDPENPIAIFDNGEKCAMALIGMLNDSNAYNDHKIMSRVESKSNVWKFDRIMPESKQGRDKDGVLHEIPDPYFFDKNGEPIKHENNAPQIKVTPPAPSNRLASPITDDYYLSKNRPKSTPVMQKPNPEPVVMDDDFDNDPMPENNHALYEPVRLSTEQMQPQQVIITQDVKVVKNILLDLDDSETTTGDLICLVRGQIENCGNLKEFLLDYFAPTEIASDPAEAQEIKQPKENDQTINLLLKDCKTEEVEIDLGLGVVIPKKAFVDYFKESYPDEWTDDMINKIVDKIDPQLIKDALKVAIKNYYNLIPTPESGS